MGSYYYIEDKNSDFGYTPVPEEEYMSAILSIARNKGIEITDELILKEVENKGYQSNLTVSKKNAKITILKSPALVR